MARRISDAEIERLKRTVPIADLVESGGVKREAPTAELAKSCEAELNSIGNNLSYRRRCQPDTWVRLVCTLQAEPTSSWVEKNRRMAMPAGSTVAFDDASSASWNCPGATRMLSSS